MEIKYDVINKIVIVILGAIFVCEGFNLFFNFGFNHHLFHIFFYCASFYLGVLLGRRCNG